MQSSARPPAVAGYFYPSDRDALLLEIGQCFRDGKIGPGFDPEKDSERAAKETGVHCYVVPHAGYTYSGSVAAHSYKEMHQIFANTSGSVTAIILGPNHYGVGSGIAISPSSEWVTPLGSTKVNQGVSNEICKSSNLIDADQLAHSREHSIEVQLPFLQSISSPYQLKIIPISLMLQDKESMEDVSKSLLKVIDLHKDETFLIIGSSDLTHYESQNDAVEKDTNLIQSIKAIDIDSYYTTLERKNVSACGYGAIAVAMILSRKLGKTQGRLLKYATSGDVSGDKSSVVGYCAVKFL